jgi:hypothetical protein
MHDSCFGRDGDLGSAEYWSGGCGVHGACRGCCAAAAGRRAGGGDAAGWRAQQLARGLSGGRTAGPRELVVRRFLEFTNEYPWAWTAAHLDEWLVHLTAEKHLAVSTVRALSDLVADLDPLPLRDKREASDRRLPRLLSLANIHLLAMDTSICDLYRIAKLTERTLRYAPHPP